VSIEVQLPDAIKASEKALALPDQARSITITDDETLRQANELLRTVKELRKEIAATFKPIKQQLDKAKKEVLAQERKADEPLKEAEQIIKPQIAAYVREQEEKRKQQISEAPETVPVEAPKLDGTSIRKVWKFEVTDFSALPDEFKKVDEAKLGAVVRALKDQCKIPGIRVFHVETVVSR